VDKETGKRKWKWNRMGGESLSEITEEAEPSVLKPKTPKSTPKRSLKKTVKKITKAGSLIRNKSGRDNKKEEKKPAVKKEEAKKKEIKVTTPKLKPLPNKVEPPKDRKKLWETDNSDGIPKKAFKKKGDGSAKKAVKKVYEKLKEVFDETSVVSEDTFTRKRCEAAENFLWEVNDSLFKPKERQRSGIGCGNFAGVSAYAKYEPEEEARALATVKAAYNKIREKNKTEDYMTKSNR